MSTADEMRLTMAAADRRLADVRRAWAAQNLVRRITARVAWTLQLITDAGQGQRLLTYKPENSC